LYSWLGNAIRPSLADLKPLQLKELDEAFATVEPGKATQERFLKSQKADQSGPQQEGIPLTGQIIIFVEEEVVTVDAYDLAEPVNLKKDLIPEFNEWITSTKWKERKDALESLLQTSKVPRIKEDNYTEIMSILGRCMKDANIVVVTVAAQCVEAIARGLRKPFGQYKSLVMMPVIEKLKERKASVVEALSNAMDAVFTAVLPFK
jgi:protein STU2